MLKWLKGFNPYLYTYLMMGAISFVLYAVLFITIVRITVYVVKLFS